MGGAVTIVSHLSVREGAQAAFEALAVDQGTKSRRSEPGCLAYVVCRSRIDACSYLVVERFADRAALNVHMAAPYVAEAQAALPGLLAAPAAIQLYDDVAPEGP